MQRFETIQVLRALAAFLVSALHIVHGIESEGFDWGLGHLLFSQGKIGVDIFFVISGFIIYYVSFHGSKPTVKEFLENRFWRVLPPYWVILISFVCLLVLLWLLLGDASKLPSLSQTVLSALLYPMAPTDYVLGVAWTLSMEGLFYLVFAFTALKFRAPIFFGAMAVWYLAALAGLIFTNDMSGWALPALNPVILEFMMGAGIAVLLLRGTPKYQIPFFTAGCLSILIILLADIGPGIWFRREFLFGLPAAMLVYGATGITWRWPSWLLLVGEASYLQYLIHIPTFLVVGRGIEELTGFNVYSSPISAFLMLMFAVALSCVLTLLIERPYQRFYKRLMKKGAVSAEPLRTSS